MRALVLVAISMSSVAAAPDRRCVIEGMPAPAAKPAKAAPCQKAKPVTAAVVRAAIAKRYYLSNKRGKAVVSFPCDGLGPKVREIVIETGSGHGGSLEMWRAVRAPDGAYEVRGIKFNERGPKNAFTLAAGTAALPGLATARAALVAKVKEVAPPPKPGTIEIGSIMSSSHDFHVLVQMTDDDGRVLERRFTGYEGNGEEQNTYRGIEIAIESLAPITEVGTTAGPPTPEDRLLFAERFNADVPHFDDEFHWWVMERFVSLARFLGSPRVIAGLVTRLTIREPDRSRVDARADALAALATITGWDARDGGKSEEDAALLYRAECAP
jgi:hypothetical protein